EKLGPTEEVYKSLMILAVFVLLGYARAKLTHIEYYAHSLKEVECKESWMRGTLLKDLKKTKFGYQSEFELEAVQIDSVWHRVGDKVQLEFKQAPDTIINEGDYLLISAYIKPFLDKDNDYYQFLATKGIFHKAYVKEREVKKRADSFFALIGQFRKRLEGRIEELLVDEKLVPLAKAMFLGNKTGLAKEVRSSFSHAGLSHILAISGLHVGIVFLCFNLLLFPLNLILHGRKVRMCLLLIFLLFYMLLTGASPAVVRAVCMLGTVLILRLFNLRYSAINIMAFSAWLQLVYDPQILFQAGFQLSYAAVFGLLLFYPLSQALIKGPFLLLNTLNGWIGVSLLASLFTAPFILYYFGEFPVYFLLANVLASALSFFLVLGGFLWMLCAEIPYVSEILANICESMLSLLQLIAKEIAHLPYSIIKLSDFQTEAVLLLMIQLLLAATLFLLPPVLFRERYKTFNQAS
ncbi:MAG: ComEC/Rec2 family competence protein, partial [Bacteroidota bacterium]